MLTDQVHKAASAQRFFFDIRWILRLAGDPQKVLSGTAADRNDQPSPHGELGDKHSGNHRRSCRNENPVKRGFLPPAVGAVADADGDVEAIQAVQDLPCRVGEGGETFDGENLSGQGREDGRLVAGTRTDLEDLFTARQGQASVMRATM
jgi:hypothetical protein